ncbi:VanZ family protein [Alkalihalobacterium elongatum]|uniref:VanZ family protein n=1 Tax=Alkalihalobacterium elongatum TaxID=2675466 RepID=UPI001C1FE94C|nr:VanZ family protein [Alkalihalobacterium elongatum]
MYFLLLMMWIYLIIILTCTKDFSGLLRGETFYFQWNNQPDFTQFFNISIYMSPSVPFMMQKAGHFVCFFILAFLLIEVCKSIRVTLLIGLFLAAATELAQPFFYREGLFVDIMINSLGVFTYVLIFAIVRALIVMSMRAQHNGTAEKTNSHIV